MLTRLKNGESVDSFQMTAHCRVTILLQCCSTSFAWELQQKYLNCWISLVQLYKLKAEYYDFTSEFSRRWSTVTAMLFKYWLILSLVIVGPGELSDKWKLRFFICPCHSCNSLHLTQVGIRGKDWIAWFISFSSVTILPFVCQDIAYIADWSRKRLYKHKYNWLSHQQQWLLHQQLSVNLNELSLAIF